MSLIQRIGYYLGGFSIGLIILTFFLNGKKTSCAYGPEARVLKSITTKPFTLSPNVSNQIDSITFKTILRRGNVNFSRSDTRREPCGVYIIESELKEKPIDLTVENCDSLITIKNLVFK
jgi:hypothetical protein